MFLKNDDFYSKICLKNQRPIFYFKTRLSRKGFESCLSFLKISKAYFFLESFLEKFLDSFFNFWNWIISWRKSSHWLAFFVHHKFGKVPFYGIKEGATLFLFQIVPKWMCIFAIDINFTEEIKAFAKFNTFSGCKSLDFSISSRLLTTKLIAGKCKDA